MKKTKNSKSKNAKKISDKKTKSKKSSIKNKLTPARKSVSHKKVHKLNPRGIFVILAGIVAIFVISLIMFPDSFSRISNNGSDDVLDATALASQNHEYSVNEDDLLMFSTLVYDDATQKGLDSNGNTVVLPDEQRSTATETKPRLIARCVYPGSVSESAKDSAWLEYVSCLKNEPNTETVTSLDKDHDNMYGPEDIIGTYYEMPDFKNMTLANLVGSAGQVVMTAIAAQEKSQTYYFSNLASLEASKAPGGNLNGWEVVDSYDSSALPGVPKNGKISAVTFKKGNDVVITFRGTDATDVYEWFVIDTSYGFKNDTQQDELAKNYALRIAKIYNEGVEKSAQKNIYVTGHSLGGYLAQIAGSGLLNLNSDNTVSNPYNLTRIVYFNGMGLFFSDKSQMNLNNYQITARDRLKAFNMKSDGTRDDKILLVHMYGDIVSSAGLNYGEIKTLTVSSDVVMKHNAQYNNIIGWACSLAKVNCTDIVNNDKYQQFSYNFLTWFAKVAQSTINKFGFNVTTAQITNTRNALDNYTRLSDGKIDAVNIHGARPNSVLSYFMGMHETDSFFYTDYYHDMVVANDKTGNAYDNNIYARNPLNVSSPTRLSKFEAPNETTQTSITKTNFTPVTDDSVGRGAFGPICRLYPNEGSLGSSITLEKSDYLSARIVCSHESGFSENTINKDEFIYEDNIVLKSLEITVTNPQGTYVTPGDNTLMYWDIKIEPIKKFCLAFCTGKVREANVSKLYLKAGAVKSVAVDGAGNVKNNDPTFYPYTIDITNSDVTNVTHQTPINIVNTNPNITTTTIITDPNPVTVTMSCSFVVPSNITAKFWPWSFVYSNGSITCEDSNGFKDTKISNSDITSSPSSRIKAINVGGAIKGIRGSGYTTKYHWNVNFRGAYASPGVTTLSLKSGAVSDINGNTNTTLISNNINVSR